MSFFERLERHAALTEKRLYELLTPCTDNEYSERCEKLFGAMRYSALGGGKRLRAFLVLQFCLAYGGKTEDALDYACAMEMMHAFSLIHDDLPAMDNDDMRRGKPSSHKAFGEATAILAGDALAIDSLRVCASNPNCSALQNLEAVRCLASHAGVLGMCTGQQLDLDGEGKKLDEEELTALVMHKTGDLIAASCFLGTLAAKEKLSGKERILPLAFGHDIGLAFQIADDLLDIRSTSEQLGKTVGKDLAEEKSTFVSLLGEEGAAQKAAEAISLAKKELALLPDSVYKTELYELCDYIIERKK
ncbi:MAG: polyprenyl synthetase family protein [Clostridia bacterium]|nr:polyprenyl synthetase family protein [Clostridia bacterium]